MYTIKDPPAKIYLITGLDESELQEDVEFDKLSNVSWCDSKGFHHDIEYTLSAPPLTSKETDSEVWEEIEQDFKELNIYIDDLYRNGVNQVKDAGNLWIQFSDKFRAFETKIKSKLQ